MALQKRSPAAGEFLFQIAPEALEEPVTALGGIPLLVRAAGSLDVPGSVARQVRVQRAGGPQGRIGFAVSARMNPALHAEVAATPESRWQFYSEESVVVKECCELDYVPVEPGDPYREPLRYVAIRIRKKQQALFADGSTVKYFAVVRNLWEWTPQRLLQWHRESGFDRSAA